MASIDSAGVFAAEPERRPNIVWIIVDDMSAHFSCYGKTLISTPHVDRLAREGTRFTKAFETAPVCSPSRSARYDSDMAEYLKSSGAMGEELRRNIDRNRQWAVEGK